MDREQQERYGITQVSLMNVSDGIRYTFWRGDKKVELVTEELTQAQLEQVKRELDEEF